jgi:RHS repeat-associated protein
LNAQRAVTASSMFDAYGREVCTITESDPFGYSAMWAYYTDDETILQLLGFRYYDPIVGQFVTRDPIGVAGGVNLYSYTTNNPLSFNDPSGLAPSLIEIAKEYIGSDRWSPNLFDILRLPGFNPNKCSNFVDDVVEECGIVLPTPHKTWYRKGRPLAMDWANTSFSIPNCAVVKTPQVGDIVAIPYPYADASGHVGFVLEPGQKSLSASGGEVITSGWPWDKGSKPQGKPTYRRCKCPDK